MTTDAPLGNLDFDDMLRYVESGHNNNNTTTTLVKSTITSATTSKFHISPRKPLENHLPISSIVVQDHQSSVKLSMEGGSRMQQQQSTKGQKRQVKKGRASYESDDDAQIAMRLARLRREVLEQQEEVEAEEVVNEHEQTDDALERLRSFRESLGIPESQQRPNNSSTTTATPKAATKMISKRRYSSSSSDKSLGGSGRKEFESPAEVSEAQLLYRLQKLRQSLTSPERSKGSASSKSSQRASSKKKRIQYLPSHAAAATNAAAELFSTSENNPQVVQDAAMLHPGLAKEIQQHWSMDLNNVMHMGFSMDQGGPVVDQFVGHGHLHQYAQ